MTCLICLEDDKNCLEEREEYIFCGNYHRTHIRCFYFWHQMQTEPIEKTRCFVCRTFLSSIELKKLKQHVQSMKAKLLIAVESDDVKEFKRCFDDQGHMTGSYFSEVVKSAMRFKALSVLTYLRQVQTDFLNLGERQSLVCEIFEAPTDTGVRWIINDFHRDLEVPPVDGRFDPYLIDYFYQKGALLEVFWFYRNYFARLPDQIKYDYIRILFREFKEKRFDLTSIPGTLKDPSRLLYAILNYNANNFCEMIGKMIPYVIMNQQDIGGQLQNFFLFVDLLSCPVCKRSHLWDAVILAIKNDALKFLQYLFTRVTLTRAPPISYRELAKLISSSNRPDEMLEIIEQNHIFRNFSKWQKIYKGVVDGPREKRHSLKNFWKKIQDKYSHLF